MSMEEQIRKATRAGDVKTLRAIRNQLNQAIDEAVAAEPQEETDDPKPEETAEEHDA